MTLIQTVWKRGHSSSVHRRFFLAWTSHAACRRPKRVMSRARVAQRSAQREGPAACNHTQAIACTRLGRVLSLALLPSSSSGHHHHHHHHSPASHTHHHHHRSSSLPSRPLSSQACSCTRRRSSVKERGRAESEQACVRCPYGCQAGSQLSAPPSAATGGALDVALAALRCTRWLRQVPLHHPPNSSRGA